LTHSPSLICSPVFRLSEFSDPDISSLSSSEPSDCGADSLDRQPPIRPSPGHQRTPESHSSGRADNLDRQPPFRASPGHQRTPGSHSSGAPKIPPRWSPSKFKATSPAQPSRDPHPYVRSKFKGTSRGSPDGELPTPPGAEPAARRDAEGGGGDSAEAYEAGGRVYECARVAPVKRGVRHNRNFGVKLELSRQYKASARVLAANCTTKSITFDLALLKKQQVRLLPDITLPWNLKGGGG
jgi:hypothetical protein